MRRLFPRVGSLANDVAEVLKNSVNEEGEQLDISVAEAPDLLGCVSQGNSFQVAREILVVGIEWERTWDRARSKPGRWFLRAATALR